MASLEAVKGDIDGQLLRTNALAAMQLVSFTAWDEPEYAPDGARSEHAWGRLWGRSKQPDGSAAKSALAPMKPIGPSTASGDDQAVRASQRVRAWQDRRRRSRRRLLIDRVLDEQLPRYADALGRLGE
jgi:hypothetical protein